MKEKEEQYFLPTEGSAEELIKELEKYIEAEIEEIENVDNRVAQEIAFHHRDLRSAIKTAVEKLEDELKEIGDLEKIPPGEEALKVYQRIFDDMRKVDESFTVSILTTVAILRYVAQYYVIRKKLSEDFEKVGKNLGEGTAKIRDIDAKVRNEIDNIIVPLAKATHSHIPPGALIKAAEALEKILEDEEVKSWITKWRAGLKKTAAKEEEID